MKVITTAFKKDQLPKYRHNTNQLYVYIGHIYASLSTLCKCVSLEIQLYILWDTMDSVV